MATVQELKRRIRSVRNTRKITRAMELVAAAKLRRAEQRIVALRPYAETMVELIAGVGRASSAVRLPLLDQRETVETVAIVPLTGDRGLAGAFNAQILRRAFALERALQAEGKAVRWITVGKKGRSTLLFRRRELSGSYMGFTDHPGYADAQAISHRVAELFTSGEVDRVTLVLEALNQLNGKQTDRSMRSAVNFEIALAIAFQSLLRYLGFQHGQFRQASTGNINLMHMRIRRPARLAHDSPPSHDCARSNSMAHHPSRSRCCPG